MRLVLGQALATSGMHQAWPEKDTAQKVRAHIQNDILGLVCVYYLQSW